MSVSTPLYINYSENGVLHHITIYTIPYHTPWDRELTGAPLISYAVSHSSGRQQRQPRPGPPPRPPSSYYAGQHLYHNNTSTAGHFRCQVPEIIKSEINILCTGAETMIEARRMCRISTRTQASDTEATLGLGGSSCRQGTGQVTSNMFIVHLLAFEYFDT